MLPSNSSLNSLKPIISSKRDKPFSLSGSTILRLLALTTTGRSMRSTKSEELTAPHFLFFKSITTDRKVLIKFEPLPQESKLRIM